MLHDFSEKKYAYIVKKCKSDEYWTSNELSTIILSE